MFSAKLWKNAEQEKKFCVFSFFHLEQRCLLQRRTNAFFLSYRAQKEKINSLQLIANSRILPIFARKGVTMKKLVKHGSMMAAAVVAPMWLRRATRPHRPPRAPQHHLHSGSILWSKVSAKSTVRLFDIGLLLSMLLKTRCQQVIALVTRYNYDPPR